MSEYWLAEPTIADETYARRGEHVLDWLARSTLPAARECREFLRANMARLPESSHGSLIAALCIRWRTAFFELIVARILQELGASVSLEQVSGDGRRPDFVASFPDYEIIVEACAPSFDADVVQDIKKRTPLLDIVEAHVPPGCHVNVLELPDIGLADSKKDFEQAVVRLLATQLPEEGSHINISHGFPQGTLRMQLRSRSLRNHKLGIEPALATIDRSEERIRRAVRKKRSQVRGSERPVLLAIQRGLHPCDRFCAGFGDVLWGLVQLGI